jgi:hypothetical protein
MTVDKPGLLTRKALEEQRAAVRLVARQDGRALALFSVGLGVAQLLFLRWADRNLAHGLRLQIAGSAFVLYMVVVGVLVWRMERRIRLARPVCPQCGMALKDLAEHLASLTGKCDSCGGWVLRPEDRT